MNINRCMRLVPLIVLFLFLHSMTADAEREPFNRHYIIVVDQTIRGGNANMGVIYRSLCEWLGGEMPQAGLNTEGSTIPEPVTFDPRNDAISLFAFGLPGDGNFMNSEYGRIHRECYSNSQNPEYVFKDIVKSLIKERERYIRGRIVPVNDDSDSTVVLSDFLSVNMRRLFNGTDPLHISISKESGITMSHFVYPLIMDFISKDETANEYYLILVSDFKSGLYSNNDENDWNTLSQMTAAKADVRKYFESQINTMRSPFVQAEYLHFQAGDIGAKGTRLVLKSVIQKSQVFLTTSVAVSQSGGSVFKVNPVRVAFDKDALTTIDSIQIVVSEDGEVLCRKTIERGDESIARLLGNNREYEIPAQEVDLGKESLGDICIGYTLYTMSHDVSGNPVLPVALSATQNIDREEISMINQQQRKNMTNLVLFVLFATAFALLVQRGRRKSLSVQIGSFAQKYMNVTDKNGAKELPCWFYHDGERSKSIRVSGRIEKKWLSIGGNTRLYVRLQDARPEGFSFYVNRRNASDFIEIEKSGADFSFNINIEMHPDKINPAELSTCSAKIDFLIESCLMSVLRRRDVIACQDDIEFYFLNDLGTAWVGLDPGTTGSCVSYGCTGGSLDDPNIRMVIVDDEEIIPSKLVLTRDISGRQVKELKPGIDFKYGMEADRNWDAYNRDGKPCFQSIKKLLGYKNSADDMIEVSWGRGTAKLTGLQLAHLLVKGLKEELDRNVSRLSQTEAMRYVGKTGRARRAVVAIPNNYTLPKITDMVNSVRMLGTFDEVRYIYEAEGILFNYFRKNYRTQHPGHETIMVYDMGGATINLSIFRVDYTEENGTIYYDVHTLGRIGYAVGGDNIDVAIMEYLFTIPNLPLSMPINERAQHPQEAIKREKERHDYQLSHKLEILQKIASLKKDIVNAKIGKSLKGNQIQNKITLESVINDILQQYGPLPSDAFSIFSEDNFAHDVTEHISKSWAMKRFVINNVKDAVEEILKYPAIESLSRVDTLVFAGRSTMFPGIRDVVLDTVKGRFRQIKVYDGFGSDEIKTSVSYGACWYGIYNSLVTLDNSRLSCAYGFKLTQGGKSHLNVLLNQNDSFDEKGNVSGSKPVSNHFDADGNVVDFYQVMGSGKGENIFSENNRHKVNFIGSIDVTTTTSEICMSVDRRNVVTYSVTFDTGDVSSFRDLNVVGRDITKENDWAYVFAATPQLQTPSALQSEPYRVIQCRAKEQSSEESRITTRRPGGSKRV